MSDKHGNTYGPSWLGAFADRMCNNGQELEAVAFRQMDKAWTEDRTEIDRLRLENSRLQERINRAASAIGEPGPYAFTGTSDRRVA